LPLGNRYGYVPRGPVIAHHPYRSGYEAEILNHIRAWARLRLGHLSFMRLEPPVAANALDGSRGNFRIPPYYVQPRRNLVIPLGGNTEEITALFHPTTRSNIKRAERRGVSADILPYTGDPELTLFFAMARDTIGRNGGRNAYPNPAYFRALIQNLSPLTAISDPSVLSLGIFRASCKGRPAAIHFVLFFGETATYLFGASYNETLPSKAVTYLHWFALQEAKKRGFRHYDLGGIDEERWPTLTQFKRQFRGEEFQYIGNLDIPLQPMLYKTYNLIQKIRKSR
jgi:lipid II:glycine glycyltransferase (peptidoglycan interpeptide bridge formation enzyme)